MATEKKKKSITSVNYGCQQNLLHPEPELKAILEFLCEEANKVYNCALYYARQIYFKTRRYLTNFELDKELKSNKHFQMLCSNSAQQICHSVGEAMRSYKELSKKSFNGEIIQRPKFPNYRRPGMYSVTYSKSVLKVKDGLVRCILSKTINIWFGIDSFNLVFPSNLDWHSIKELRILPRNGCFYAEWVYVKGSKSELTKELDSSIALGIDHGIDNWLTCVPSHPDGGSSFIIDGLHLKSLNRWYNKQIAHYKEGKAQGFWSKRLASITEKRNRRMRDAINKAARTVINKCLKNGIGTIIFGWNLGQKDSSNLGTKTNQKFVQIPTAKLKNRLEQLCTEVGIRFVETEEAYTSIASAIDEDSLPKYGEKPEGWKTSGKRISRGQYRTKDGLVINADCNGAGNIIRKVAGILGLTPWKLSRVSLTTPIRINLWMTARSVKSDGFSLALN